MSLVPTRITERYKVIKRLGAGGMAEVFLTKLSGEGGFEKLVVIKRILPHFAEHPEFRSMFLDEAKTAADLRHSNIVTLFEVGSSEGAPFIAMEYLHGKDLDHLQKKLAERGEAFPLEHAAQVILDAARGLQYAHQKQDLHGVPLSIVHRDVSPHNILITFEGNTKILDFGIAKAASKQTQTRTGVVKGKYAYMSPEQAGGDEVDARTDQFALGIVFWELLTGKRLFRREDEMKTRKALMESMVPAPSAFNSDIPKSVDIIVMRMLERVRFARFESLADAANALEDALDTLNLRHSGFRLGQFIKDIYGAEAVVRLSPTHLATPASPSSTAPDDPTRAKIPPAPSDDERPALEVTADQRRPSLAPASLQEATKDTGVASNEALKLGEQMGRNRSPVALLAVAALFAVVIGAIFFFGNNTPGGGSVELSTVPAGARIYWAGQLKEQRTPATFRDVPLGEQEVRFELANHVVKRTTFRLTKRGQHLLVNEKLIRFRNEKEVP